MALWEALGIKQAFKDLVTGNLGGYENPASSSSTAAAATNGHQQQPQQRQCPPPPHNLQGMGPASYGYPHMVHPNTQPYVRPQMVHPNTQPYVRPQMVHPNTQPYVRPQMYQPMQYGAPPKNAPNPVLSRPHQTAPRELDNRKRAEVKQQPQRANKAVDTMTMKGQNRAELSPATTTVEGGILEPPNNDICAMSVSKLSQWLASIELPQEKIDLFAKEGVNGRDLVEMDENDMMELGLSKFQVKKVMKALGKRLDPKQSGEGDDHERVFAATMDTTQGHEGGGPYAAMQPHYLVDIKPNYLVEIKPNEIVLGRCLGSGSFKQVFLGRWRGTDVAVCEIKGAVDNEQLKEEVSLLAQLRHPNIVLLMGIYTSEDNAIAMVTEYCSGGNLYDLLFGYRCEQGKRLDMGARVEYAVEIMRGIAFIHQAKICHRDIKPQNVLLDEKGTCKIADFGVSKILWNSNPMSRTVVGTPTYMAPELMDNKPYNPFAADVYSCAILLFELFSNVPAFSNIDNVFHLMIFLQTNRPPVHQIDGLPGSIMLLIDSMWSTDAEQRPSTAKVLEQMELTRLSFQPNK